MGRKHGEIAQSFARPIGHDFTDLSFRALSGQPSSPRTRPDRGGFGPRFGAPWRGGRVVECTALEMRHRCKPIGGSNPSLSATLRHSSPLYPIVRNCRKTTEELRDSGLTLRASCSFPPWVRRTVLPPLHYSPLYPIVRIDSKNNGRRDKGCAASPLIAAQTVPFGSRFGGWILRGRPGVTLPALRVAIRFPRARSGQRVRQFPNYWKHLFEDTPLCGAVPLGDGPECSLS
jgi:hypothetical protein